MPATTTTHTVRNLSVGMAVLVVIVIAILLAANVGRLSGASGVACRPVPGAALTTIASGARIASRPLTLTDGVAADTIITSAMGQEQGGILVAARTPIGTGVWALDRAAYRSGQGLVYAVNGVAESTTIWGAETNYIPVDADDVAALEACVGTPSADG